MKYLSALILLILSTHSIADISSDPKSWYPVTDNVMGGISDLQVTHNDGVFLMQGTVSTKNNGGFVRFGQDVSFKDNSIKGIRFKAKGNNESYEIHVTLKGIKMPPWSYFSNSFAVSEDWQEYEIYFSDFSREGYSARSMQPKNIRNLSFAGYGRDFPVDLAIKDISVIN
jgi:hypothetical protein